jgi:ribosome-associated protein
MGAFEMLKEKLVSYFTMKPNQTDDSQPDIEPISKTQRKAAMDDLQDIGVKLIDLPKDKLGKLNLPERLLDAVQEAKRITANGAKKRQRQYIGSLMREVDVEPIIDQLQRWEGKHTAESAHFHQMERWRDRLLSEDSALSEFMRQYPHADGQQLRALIRNSQREAAAGKPPKSSREMFKLLRNICEREISETETPGE